jgi:cystathionine beta-lyase
VFGLAATLAALTRGDDWLAAQLDYLRANAGIVETFVNQTSSLSMAHVEATYLAWIDCSGIPDAGDLLLRNGVAVYPGAQFGDPRFVRLNFGTQRSRLQEALNRIRNASRPSPRG